MAMTMPEVKMRQLMRDAPWRWYSVSWAGCRNDLAAAGSFARAMVMCADHERP